MSPVELTLVLERQKQLYYVNSPQRVQEKAGSPDYQKKRYLEKPPINEKTFADDPTRNIKPRTYRFADEGPD